MRKNAPVELELHSRLDLGGDTHIVVVVVVVDVDVDVLVDVCVVVVDDVVVGVSVQLSEVPDVVATQVPVLDRP